MASTGGGKMRPKRSHGANKPYQRNRPRSFLDRVKDLVTPSWLSNMWKSSEPNKSPSQENPTRQLPLSSNSIPPRQTIPDGQYFVPEETDTEPGPSTRPFGIRGHQVGEQRGEGMSTPVLNPCAGLSVPVSTSTPIDVDEDVIDIEAGEGPSTQRGNTDDVSEVSAPPSVVSSLYPNLDKLEHQQKLSESNLEVLSDMGHRQSPVPSSSLWSRTPAGLSATPRPRPASPFSRPQQPAISTRRPAFNPSYFGTPRGTARTPSMMESSSSSPFYPGRTTYGGASAQRPVGSKRSRTSPYEVHLPIKRSVRPRLAKPADESDMGITSNTAKRILDTLEKMSTPLSDAKRIPLSPSASPLAFRASRTPRPKQPASPHRAPGLGTRSVRIPGPPVSGLSIPHTVSIAPNRQPAVPAGASTARKAPAAAQADMKSSTPVGGITKASQPTHPALPHRHVQSVSARTSTPPPVSEVDTTPVQSTGFPRASSGGKMKQKRSTAHYSTHKDQDEDVVEVPDLPQIPLPLKTLPSFNFGAGLQPPKSSTEAAYASASTAAAKLPSAGPGLAFVASTPAVVPVPSVKDSGDHEFTFASPILKQTASTISAPEFETIEDFSFSLPKRADVPSAASTTSTSKPLNFVNLSSSSSSSSLTAAPATFTAFTASGSNNSSPKPPAREDTEDVKGDAEEEEEERGFGIKPAKTLKTGSCLEVFGIFSDPASTSAPTTTTTTEAAPPATDIFAKFKPLPGSWTCDTCLLQNKAGDSVCIACQSANPNPPASNSSSEPANPPDIFAKFKPPEGSWTCSTCMLQNKKNADKCIACEAPSLAATQKSAAQPSPSPSLNNSIFDKFRPPPGSWTCDTCLVQNKEEATECIACMVPKPNAAGSNPTSGALTNSTPVFGSKTDSPKSKELNSTDNSFMDKFKPPAGSWTCDTCLLQNKSTTDRCIACETPKPGSQPALKTPPASAFKFGIQSSSLAGGIKFGGNSSSSSSSNMNFTSGKLNLPTSGFKFGSQNASKDSQSSGIQLSLPKDGSGIKFGSNADPVAKTNSILPSGTGIKFGSDSTNQNESGFKLGTSGGIKFGSDSTSQNESGFKLGTSGQDDKPAGSSGFQFGAPISKSDSSLLSTDPLKTAAPSKVSFGSGVNAVTATQDTDSKAAPKGGFSFGVSKDDSSAPKLNFGSTTAESKDAGASFSFGGKAPTDSGTIPPITNQATFKFGAGTDQPSSTVQDSAAKPMFKFGAAPSADASEAAAAKPTSVSSGFSFGSAPTNTVNATQPTAPHQNSVAPTFQFGNSNAGSDEAGTGQQPASKGITFASTIEQNPVKDKAAPFIFGGASSQPATQQSTPFLFGSTENKEDAPSKTNGGITFGAPAQSIAPVQSDKPFTFGAASNNNKPGGFNFSATANNAAPATGGFQFGASAVTSAATPTQQQPPAFGGFSGAASTANTFGSAFGGQPTTNSTPNPFGGQQPAAAPAFGAPSGTSIFGGATAPAFGTGASAENSRSSTPTFGTATTGVAPGFGNTGSSFGSGFPSNAAPSFNFGAGNASTAAPGVFAFGAAANNTQNAVGAAPGPQAAAPTGGFTFGQQQPQQQQQSSGFGMPGGVQNASGTGLFTFTGGQAQTPAPAASFSMGAPGGQQRKIRKAVRRARKP